jgi:hypothetical protein
MAVDLKSEPLGQLLLPIGQIAFIELHRFMTADADEVMVMAGWREDIRGNRTPQAGGLNQAELTEQL